METAQAVGPEYDRDSQEYVEFCKNCGLLLPDGIQMWRTSATRLIRGMEYPKPNTSSIQDAMG